jgi:hypothetical protein
MISLSTCCRRRLIPWGLVLLLCPGLSLGAGEMGADPAASIAAILVEARRALTEDRLTVPAGHNAVAYAQQVLDLAPGHAEAQQILRAVVERYGLIAGAAVDRAKVYRSRGEGVARRYAISPQALSAVAARLDALPERAGPANPGRDDPATLRRLVDTYRHKGEVALEAGLLREARRYADLAGQIARDHRVANTSLAALEGRVVAAERVRRQAMAEAAPPAGAWAKAVFLPPSF